MLTGAHGTQPRGLGHIERIKPEKNANGLRVRHYHYHLGVTTRFVQNCTLSRISAAKRSFANVRLRTGLAVTAIPRECAFNTLLRNRTERQLVYEWWLITKSRPSCHAESQRSERPRPRTMLVLAPLIASSALNHRGRPTAPTYRPGWLSRHARRAWATSGPFCSAACRVFF